MARNTSIPNNRKIKKARNPAWMRPPPTMIFRCTLTTRRSKKNIINPARNAKGIEQTTSHKLARYLITKRTLIRIIAAAQRAPSLLKKPGNRKKFAGRPPRGSSPERKVPDLFFLMALRCMNVFFILKIKRE